jgi:transcriptional regulator with XRE-family HTH domain
MSPRRIVAALIASGLSQAKIARTCKTSQATISRLLTGRHQNVSYLLMDRLRALHSRRVAKAQSA